MSKKRNGSKDGEDDEKVEVVEKGPCQDCYRIDWEYAHRDESGKFFKCDKCHVWDSEQGRMVPRVLH